jgi:hypothetical protein
VNREQILAVLYDLTLTIGGEVKVDALLTKVLQRLLFHTSFPAGVVMGAGPAPAEPAPCIVAAVVGDHALAQHKGQAVALPRPGCRARAHLSKEPNSSPGCKPARANTGTC